MLERMGNWLRLLDDFEGTEPRRQRGKITVLVAKGHI